MRIPNSNTESLHSMFIARFMTRPESAKENCRAGKIGNEIYSSDVLRVLQCYSAIVNRHWHAATQPQTIYCSRFLHKT